MGSDLDFIVFRQWPHGYLTTNMKSRFAENEKIEI
jgi:hypothetical protein